MGRANAKSPFPPPPDQFYNRHLQQFIETHPKNNDINALSLQTSNVHGLNNGAGVLDRDYIDYIMGAMATRHIYFFTMDWGAHIDDQFNQIMIQFFTKVWKWGLTTYRFKPAAKKEAERLNMEDKILAAIYVRHYKYLRTQYKKLIVNPDALIIEQARNSQSVALLRVCSFLLICLTLELTVSMPPSEIRRTTTVFDGYGGFAVLCRRL